MTEAIFSYEPGIFAGFNELVEIALDLRWSWSHAADDIWRPLDPELWDLTRNPWVILETVSPEKIRELSSNKKFRARVKDLAEEARQARSGECWFKTAYPNAPLSAIAYFSMEFMLGEALPIYSGGLGNVAGDQLKGASDLGVPAVGVGLLYQQGYFRQTIAADGSQSALYPYNDPGQLQVAPARNREGKWIRISVQLPSYRVWVRGWQAQIGRLKLYLLDTNDPANPPVARGITSQLYGGGPDVRLAQEIVLGIGGWRLLRALDFSPEVCHMNEGHSAFVVLERAADLMDEMNLPFDAALYITRAGNLFTTHTPVAAGFDRFSTEIMEQHFRGYARDRLHIPLEKLLAFGRLKPADDDEPFNMAYLALRGSGAVNGVSRLHGGVSRAIFQPLFPRWPEQEIPIGHVTNGIHIPTWDSKASDEMWTRDCGPAHWLEEPEVIESRLTQVSDETLWDMRCTSRKTLVAYARDRYMRQLTSSGRIAGDGQDIENILNPDALTLGFARRFTAYKRPTLLLHDPERLVRILTNPERPVQLILAGKAHPADAEGQEMIRQWILFTRRPDVVGRVVFLSDYDMILTEQLVGGVDVWLNTPRRPWEACGTSGMKVLVNGGLNLSELDGWWAEAYSPEVGWALGDGQEHGKDPSWDEAEANALYAILEKQVIPQFYRRDERGVPSEWLLKMRKSMSTLTTRFSAHRAVKEYTNGWYLPAAEKYASRSSHSGQNALEAMKWTQAIESGWQSMSFSSTQVETMDGQHTFRVAINLGALDPSWVTVELYAETGGDTPLRQTMVHVDQAEAAKNTYVYTAQVPSARPPEDFTPRVIPANRGFAVPLELDLILWQR